MHASNSVQIKYVFDMLFIRACLATTNLARGLLTEERTQLSKKKKREEESKTQQLDEKLSLVVIVISGKY